MPMHLLILYLRRLKYLLSKMETLDDLESRCQASDRYGVQHHGVQHKLGMPIGKVKDSECCQLFQICCIKCLIRNHNWLVAHVT